MHHYNYTISISKFKLFCYRCGVTAPRKIYVFAIPVASLHNP